MRTLKRILALALTVLMVFGVIPITIFAVDGELPVVPEQDYIGNTAGKSSVDTYKYGTAYWQKIPYNAGSVDPTGRKVSGSRLFTFRSGVSAYNDTTGLAANVWKKNLAGLDMALDMSFKLDNTKEGSMLIGVLTHFRGGITLLDARSYGDGTAELYYYNSENSGATEKKLCDLSADNYTRVQILLDVGGTSASSEANTVYIFLDGKLVVSDYFLASSSIASLYKFFTEEEYAKGFMASGYFFNPNSTAAVIDVEKFTPYLYDADADGEVTDSPRGSGVVNTSSVNEGLVQSLYNANSKYWQEIEIDTGSQNPDASGHTISHAANYRWFTTRKGVATFNDTTALQDNVWKKNLAGLDMVIDMSIKMDNSKSGNMLIGILNCFNGGVTLLDARSYGNGKAELYYTNSDNGGATERKLCDLPENEYTRVQMLFDLGGTSTADDANTLYVFIDGRLVVNDIFAKASVLTSMYKFFSDRASMDEGYGKGYMISGYFFNPYNSAGVIDVENVAMYLYDDDGDGDVTDSLRTNRVMHFNDFENEAADAEYEKGTSFAGTYPGLSKGSTTSHPVKILGESNGNKAIYTESSGDTYYQVYGQNVQNADFVLSFDVKMKQSTTSHGSMFWAGSTGSVAYNLTPIATRADGGLYIGDLDGYMITNVYNGSSGNTKIGQLSTERYTNIAIVFNISSNEYAIYIDGINKTGSCKIFDDATKKLYTDAGCSGFYLTQIRMQYRNYYMDNITLYYGNNYGRTTEIEKGYVKQNGKLYYYENGFAAANKDIDQGIVITDESGAVKVGNTYPAALNAVYTYIGNGDKVLVDGLYSGIYNTDGNKYYYENNRIKTNALLTLEENLYYADEYGAFVKNAIKGISGVFYEFDANGIGTTVTDTFVDVTGNETYDNLDEAVANLADGATLTLNGDIELSDSDAFEIYVDADKEIVFDLNGKDITASGLATFGKVILTDSGDAVIKVAKGNIACDFESDKEVVIWNEAKGGYTVSEIIQQKHITVGEERDNFELVFRPTFGDTAFNKMIFNEDSQIRIDIVIKCNDTVIGGPFTFKEELVKEVYKDNTKALSIKVRNIDNNKYNTLDVECILYTSTGASCRLEAGSVSVAKKKISILGDSISTYDGWSNNVEHNFTMGSNYIFYSATNPYKPGADFPVENTWWHKVSHNSEFDFCVNNSVSGSRVNMEASHVTRPQNLHNTTTGETPDIIIIYIGINDWAASVPLGSYDGSGELPATLSTFSVMYANIIKQAKEAYPEVEIYCCTLLAEQSRGTNGVNGAGVSIKQYNNTIATIAGNMGATVIDLYEDSGITFGNLSQYTLDMLHPNTEGMQLIADTVLDVLSSKYEKKKLSILGDSISTYSGTVPEGNRTYYGPNGEYGHLATNDVTDVSYMWWHQLMVEKGYKLEVNQSYSSSPVSNVGFNGADASGFSFINRMKNIGNPDVIAIYGGTNDALGAAEVGEYKYENWTADDLKTFRPAYAYMLSYLLENHPNADIVVIIQPNLDNRKTGIADSIKEICEHYGVQYVELPETLDLHDANGTNAHPSKLGMQQVFEAIKDYFN